MDNDQAWCANCNVELELVRPGKHQHPDPDCEQIEKQQAKQSEPWWKKHVTFRWSDAVVEEVMGPDWDKGDQALSPGEIKELAQDFLTLKQKFRNIVGWAEAGDDILDYYLDKIDNYSDEELLQWRKQRNDKIAADRKVIEKIFDKDFDKDPNKK